MGNHYGLNTWYNIGGKKQVECATLQQNRNYCEPNPCENGACIGGINGFHCICNPNWKGKTCNKQSKLSIYYIEIQNIVTIVS